MNAPDLLDWQRHKEAEGHYVYQWRGYTIHLWTEPGLAELWEDRGEVATSDSGDVHWLAHVAYEMESRP